MKRVKMIWTRKENARKYIATENPRMGKRGNMNEGKTQRKTDGRRRNATNHGLTEEDTSDKDMWRKLVLGEGRPLYSEQILEQIKSKIFHAVWLFVNCLMRNAIATYLNDLKTLKACVTYSCVSSVLYFKKTGGIIQAVIQFPV
jgi:hypothetical protein